MWFYVTKFSLYTYFNVKIISLLDLALYHSWVICINSLSAGEKRQQRAIHPQSYGHQAGPANLQSN